ncbi:MAG TPA: hypothetical protein PKW90_17700, partial [Myxococcota bacterium]|nr:hypothetical protein [Myxococcota bacterium]
MLLFMTSPRRRIAIVFAVVVVVDLLIFWRLRSSHGTAAGPAPHGSPSVSASGGASTPGSRPQPSWAVPYGREPWRKAVAAIPRGSKLEPGTPALANLMDRVSSAFRASPSGDGMEAAGSGYRARVANNGLGITALPPAHPKVQPSGTALPDLKPAEATFHTLYVSRGTTRLYQESRAAADWSYSGNTVQALRTPDGGLIEHYEARRDGVEVTWYLSKPPAGSGPLVISARMEGLRYAGLTSGGMHFTDTQGTARVRVGIRSSDRLYRAA